MEPVVLLATGLRSPQEITLRVLTSAILGNLILLTKSAFQAKRMPGFYRSRAIVLYILHCLRCAYAKTKQCGCMAITLYTS
jgi:hypothetical protein